MTHRTSLVMDRRSIGVGFGVVYSCLFHGFSLLCREKLLPLDLEKFKGQSWASLQVERILMHTQSSAIQATAAYKSRKKSILESCQRSIRPRPWESNPHLADD